MINPHASQIKEITVNYTTDGSGDASVATTETVTGLVMGARFNPTDAHTADYDATILDADSIDILGGNGGDLHTTASEYRACLVENEGAASFSADWVPVNSVLTVVIASGGATKAGVVKIYVMVI
jgi:hypothetical protein